METSYNGWPASTDPKTIEVTPFVIAGITFGGGVRAGDVHTVLAYIAGQHNDHVEPLIAGQCWGYSYRQNRNADNLSCHASATAIDCNSARHPNGVEATATFSSRQIDTIHQNLASLPELDEVVHWGGDWHTANGLTPDPMHYEIHDHDLAKLARVADRIRTHAQGDDMPYTDWPQPDKDALVADIANAIMKRFGIPDPDLGQNRSLKGTLVELERDVNAIKAKLGV